jgi:molybdate transport system substrate-binding protein
MAMNKILRRVIPTALCLFAGMLASAYASADTINVAVANSTCNAMQQLGKLFEQRSGHRISYQCKASGLLAKGLKGGAISADIYVSASKEWMDFMIDAGMVKSEHVMSPWGNELVVAATQSSPLKINDWSELATPKVKTILIGDPGTAPFGRYAKQAMQHTAIWDQVKNKIVTKKHITLLADTLADADGTTVGILFRSNTTSHHRILFKIDENWHTPIRYYAAPLKRVAESAVISEFLHFIRSKEAQLIFEAEGFRVYAS